MPQIYHLGLHQRCPAMGEAALGSVRQQRSRRCPDARTAQKLDAGLLKSILYPVLYVTHLRTS